MNAPSSRLPFVVLGLLLFGPDRGFSGVDASIVESTANRMTLDVRWGDPDLWDGDYGGNVVFTPSSPGDVFGSADIIYFPNWGGVVFDFINHASFVPEIGVPPILSGLYAFSDASDPVADGGTWYYTYSLPSLSLGVFSTAPAVFPLDGVMPVGSPPIGLTGADAYGARFVFGEPYAAAPYVPEGNLLWAWIPFLVIGAGVAMKRRRS